MDSTACLPSLLDRWETSMDCKALVWEFVHLVPKGPVPTEALIELLLRGGEHVCSWMIVAAVGSDRCYSNLWRKRRLSVLSQYCCCHLPSLLPFSSTWLLLAAKTNKGVSVEISGLLAAIVTSRLLILWRLCFRILCELGFRHL